MNRFDKNGNFYEALPRFVKEMSEESRFLPVIKRSFEHNGVEFGFEIAPANIGNTNFYPGAVEELVEGVLRRLAVENNPNFKKNDGTVIFSITELKSRLEDLEVENHFNREQIMRSLSILCRLSYELSDGERRMDFRPIDWLRKKEKDGETYYMVRLSPLFLNGNEMFNFCFGSENPKKFNSKDE